MKKEFSSTRNKKSLCIAHDAHRLLLGRLAFVCCGVFVLLMTVAAFAQTIPGAPYGSAPYGEGEYGIGVTDSDTCALRYPAGSTPQDGYGTSWNVFGSGQELLLGATCLDTFLNITAGADIGVLYTYNSGYAWNGSSWQQFAFSGDNAVSVWFRNSVASATVPRADGTTFFVSYMCQYIDNDWKCGCSDTTCANPKWQLQAVE